MNYLCSGFLVIMQRRRHSEGVTVAVCWINAFNHHNPFSCLILGLQRAGLQRGPGSRGRVLEKGMLLPGRAASGSPARQLPEATGSPATPSSALCYGNVYLDMPGLPSPLLSWRVKHTRSGRALPLHQLLRDFLPARTVPGADKWKSSLISFWPGLLNGGLPLSWSQLSQ